MLEFWQIGYILYLGGGGAVCLYWGIMGLLGPKKPRRRRSKILRPVTKYGRRH